QLRSVSCPQPLASARSQPCAASCGDSRAVLHPPPVLLTFPGPVLSSCPQESIVGAAFPPAMGNSFASCQPGASFGGWNSS
ncbi:KRSC protein, partial [Orthonyx spaldingii]|nr:KRSC protein [Orthonyx spaldingii]